MKIDEIQELIKFIAKSGVSEVELESKDFKITIKTPPRRRKGMVVVEDEENVTDSQPAPVQVIATAPVSVPPPPASAPVSEEPKPVESTPSAGEEAASGGGSESIKAPMIGTFYRSPAPDKPTFVNVGDEINKGDVICIIEAMKLFNEIEAEVSGKIVKVLVDDATPVEYDQPIFEIEPY